MRAKSGNTKSCGCVTKERMTGSALRKTHGEGDWRNSKRTPEYMTWLDMKWRCDANACAAACPYRPWSNARAAGVFLVRDIDGVSLGGAWPSVEPMHFVEMRDGRTIRQLV